MDGLLPASGGPSLRVVILEAEYAGFGASGRNGGWASALFPKSLHNLANDSTGSRPSPSTPICVRVFENSNESLARKDRGRHPAGRHHRAHPQSGPTDAGSDGDREARQWGLGPDQLAGLEPDEARARSTQHRSTAPPTHLIVRPSNPPNWLGDWRTAVERMGGTIYRGPGSLRSGQVRLKPPTDRPCGTHHSGYGGLHARIVRPPPGCDPGLFDDHRH